MILFQIHKNFAQTSDYYIPISVTEMQNATDRVFNSLNVTNKRIWEPFLTNMFKGTNTTLHLNDTDLIYIDPFQVKYLFMITGFVSALPDVVIELWVWWMTVNALIINTTSDVREFYQKQSAPFKNVLLRTRYVRFGIFVG